MYKDYTMKQLVLPMDLEIKLQENEEELSVEELTKMLTTVEAEIVEDAGYGSEQNYEYIIEQCQKDALIPYGMYRKEQKRNTKRMHLT